MRKVDKAGGKLTLKHGEIKSLDMPPMTMVFEVKDKALLDTVVAASAGHTRMMLGVNRDNERAQGLYFDAGFTGASVHLERRFGR